MFYRLFLKVFTLHAMAVPGRVWSLVAPLLAGVGAWPSHTPPIPIHAGSARAGLVLFFVLRRIVEHAACE